MKKIWQTPELEIVGIPSSEVIRTSPVFETGVNAEDWFNATGEGESV